MVFGALGRTTGAGTFPFVAFSSGRVPNGVRQKQRIIRQLIEGRLPLLDAVREFRAIHRRSAADLERSLGCQTVPSDTEGLCRTVIGWVALELSDRPDLADDVSGRLETELNEILARTDRPTP